MSEQEDARRTATVGPGVLAAAAVVTVIVLLGIYLVVSNSQDSSGENLGAAPGSTSSPTPAAQEEDSVCGLEEPANDTPLLTAPKTEWELINNFAIPSIEGSGPGLEKDGVRSCFARSRTGALLAAASIYSWNPPRDYKTLVKCCIAAGVGREAYFRGVAGVGEQEPATGPGPQFAGFSVKAYDGKVAAIVLGFRTPSGTFAEHLVDLVWEEGDWRLLLADDGTYRSMPRAVPDLAGLIPWGGV